MAEYQQESAKVTQSKRSRGVGRARGMSADTGLVDEVGQTSRGRDNIGRGRGRKKEVPPSKEQKDVSGLQSKLYCNNTVATKAEAEKAALVKSYNLTESLLQSKCSDDHMVEIKEFISWEEVGRHLPKITRCHLRDIDNDGRTQQNKRQLLVDKWEERNGDDATYDAMITAMLKAGKKAEATKVCQLLQSLSGTPVRPRHGPGGPLGPRGTPVRPRHGPGGPLGPRGHNCLDLYKVKDEDTDANTDPAVDNNQYQVRRARYAESMDLQKTFSDLYNDDLPPHFKNTKKRLLTAMESAMCECNMQCTSDLRKELEERTKTLKDKTEVAYEIFVVLYSKSYITPHRLDVLKVMIRQCIPSNEEANQLFSQYEEKLSDYLSNRINDVPIFQNSPTKIPECTGGKLYLLTDDTWDSNTSQRHLYNLERIVSQIVGKPIQLELVSPGGSLILRFQVAMKCSLTFDFDDSEDILKLLNVGVSFLKQYGTKDIHKTYETILDEKRQKSLPSSPRADCVDWKELPLTPTAVSSLLERSLPLDNEDWSLAFKCFGVEKEGDNTTKIQAISQTWLKGKLQGQNKEWWKLGIKLLRCCNHEKVADVHRLMENVVTYNNKDAPFDVRYIMEVIGLASDRSGICRKLMERYDEHQFEDYLRRNPLGFSWKNIALMLYKLGEERSLNKLFNLMRSPEDVSFMHTKIEEIVCDQSIDFNSLCQKLLSVPPPQGGLSCYNIMGIKLWLLISPRRTWVDFSWGLYMSHMDGALKKAKENIIIDGEKQFENAEKILQEAKNIKKIAWYLKDRNICEQKNSDNDSNEMPPDKWINEWSELYPVTTRTVLYQALIFAGEHKLAKDIKVERKICKAEVQDIIEDVLDVTKQLSDESWKAFFYHLTRVKEVSEDITETQELCVKEHGRESCVKYYMETSTFSWRDMAKASYGSGEASVIEKLFNDIIKDDVMKHNRQRVHSLLERYVQPSDEYNTFYNELKLRPPSGSWPRLASIDFWLLTCPLSWRELAWCFYKCKIPSAVIEIKKEFIKDEFWDEDSVPSSTKAVELALVAKAKEMKEQNEWLKFHSRVPLTIVISALNRDQGSVVRDTLNHFHVRGCLLTRKNLTTVLKLFFLREKGINWEKYAGYFHIDYSELADESLTAVEKVSKISELWYQKRPFPIWWELSDILHMCCDYCPEDIRFVMMDIHEHIVNDMKFSDDNVMNALEGVEAWEEFYFTLTGKRIYEYYPEYEDDPKYRRASFMKFNENYTGKISWKNVAEAAYLCGEEKVLCKLSNCMLSPEDPTLCYRAIEVLLDNQDLTPVHFAGLNAELGLPLLVQKCSNTFGMRFWLLSDPKVVWADLAVALYNIDTPETDNILRELKQKYLPNTDPTFNKCNLEEVMKEVTEWRMLGYLIGDRNSQDEYTKFEIKTGNVENLTQLMLLEWQELHPYASWTLLYQGLMNINELELEFSKCIKDKYLSDEDRSINIVSMNCVFSGPPRSGKTTVMKRLKDEKVDVTKLTISTDIIDERGPVRMDIMPSCNVVTDQNWVEMEESDEVQAFLNLTIIPNNSDVEMNADEASWRDEESEELYNTHTLADDVHIDTHDVREERQDDTENEINSKQTLEYTPENIIQSKQMLDDESKNKPKSESQELSSLVPRKNAGEHSSLKQPEYIKLASGHPLPSPQDVLKQAQHHSQQIRATRQLCKRHFLNLTDTGGQPELRRFTPLLIPGPSITFIVFRLTDELNDCLASKICLKLATDPKKKEVPYGSCYCIKDTIQDIILHIFCQEQHSKVRSSIMFIGTHKDQYLKDLDLATKEKRIKDKNKELMEILEKCPHYDKDMIVKSGDKAIFSVDNSIFENEHRCIRSSVLGLCDSDEFNVTVNPQQLLLALTLRGAKQTVMSLKDCTSVATQCGIEEYDVIRSLSILEKMIVVRFFRIKSNMFVVVKPKVLSKKVSMVLKHLMVMQANDPTCYPVISYEKLEVIAKDRAEAEENIKTAIFIEILLHLLIIAPDTSGLETQYIVPSMLPQSLPTAMTGVKVTDNMIPSIADDETFAKTQSNELIITVNSFKFGIPSTLHSLVLCSLLQDIKWTVKIKKSSRTCTLFSSRENDMASFQLSFLKEGISLSLMTNDWKQSTDILKECMNAKNAVSHALQDACILVGYGEPVVTSYYLPCLRHNCTIQDGGSLIAHDCIQSHSTSKNVWFFRKSSLFRWRKGKTRDKDLPRIPAPALEEEVCGDNSDSSSEDEKGATIKFKPKLRPVSERKPSQLEDDFDLSYPQLFERVFVVILKQDPDTKKLATEVTYTFPPRPTAETSRDETMESIPQFCFPDIESLKPTTKFTSETFSFVLTNMEGHRRFGYCRRLLPSGRGARLPEVTCLISPLGCFSLYEKILDHIEARRQVSQASVFTFLKAMVANPFPKPGRTVQVRAISSKGGAMETVTLERPLDSRLEHVDFSLLFSTLSPRKIIQLFSSMLMERRIILCSSNLSLLTGCAHALLALIYPFEWQHVFIPILPGGLVDFCCSPMPYLMGMNPSLIPTLDEMETMEEALVVDLDKKKFVKKIGDEVSILPSKLFQYLEHTLSSQTILGEYHKPASKRSNPCRADKIVTNTFMIFFVYLYGDYKLCMKERSDGAMEFQKKEYEQRFSSKSIRRFLEAFHMTQMFENFLEQRENPLKSETTAQSTFERRNIHDMRERCVEIEIFSSKSKISRWRLKKRI